MGYYTSTNPKPPEDNMSDIFYYGHPVTITAFRGDCDEALIKDGNWISTHSLQTNHPGGLTAAVREASLALLPNAWSKAVGEIAYASHNATSVLWCETAVHIMFFSMDRRNEFEAEMAKTTHRVEPFGGWDFLVYEA